VGDQLGRVAGRARKPDTERRASNGLAVAKRLFYRKTVMWRASNLSSRSSIEEIEFPLFVLRAFAVGRALFQLTERRMLRQESKAGANPCSGDRFRHP
jgi:hypothetical protein